MSYFYILKSKKDNKYYIGSTNNIERRLKEHNRGQTKSTKFRRPFNLVFFREFNSFSEAKKAEIKLKRLKNKNIIDKIVSEQKIKES